MRKSRVGESWLKVMKGKPEPSFLHLLIFLFFRVHNNSRKELKTFRVLSLYEQRVALWLLPKGKETRHKCPFSKPQYRANCDSVGCNQDHTLLQIHWERQIQYNQLLLGLLDDPAYPRELRLLHP